ncbi:hypothetical protein PMI21_03626 [Pseudomonas sp. GM18]|nr:hypothetical protein PMI21_03626 [Pseudomonas sp. GM18]
MQTYHLFISHSWNYSDAHDNLVRLLGAQALGAYYRELALKGHF